MVPVKNITYKKQESRYLIYLTRKDVYKYHVTLCFDRDAEAKEKELNNLLLSIFVMRSFLAGTVNKG